MFPRLLGTRFEIRNCSRSKAGSEAGSPGLAKKHLQGGEWLCRSLARNTVISLYGYFAIE
jgi:hypothetical protein